MIFRIIVIPEINKLMPFLFFSAILLSMSYWQTYRSKAGQCAFFSSFILWMIYVIYTCIGVKDLFIAILGSILCIGVFGVVHHTFKLRFGIWPLFVSLIFTASGFFFFKRMFTSPISSGLDPNAELLIELQDQADLQFVQSSIGAEILSITKAFTLDQSDSPLDNYYLVDVRNTPSSLHKVKKALSTYRQVVHLENNELLIYDQPLSSSSGQSINSWTNDPGLAKQWYLNYLGTQAFHQQLLEKKPLKTSLLAILDTGVDSKHEDLSSNFISIGASHDNDLVGHGTHCAGIAAAVTGNAKGIASFIPAGSDHVRVTSIKVLKYNGSGTQKDIIDGIIQATDFGAAVISLSLGGLSDDQKQRAYELAVDYAATKNAVIVVAAGNQGADARRYSPANVRGVIVVTALDQNGQLASFSNYLGPLSLGIAAPGVNIYSTIPGNKYIEYNGTSMAAPIVASSVAIIKSLRPQWNTDQIYNHIGSSPVIKTEVKTGLKLKLDNLLAGL